MLSRLVYNCQDKLFFCLSLLSILDYTHMPPNLEYLPTLSLKGFHYVALGPELSMQTRLASRRSSCFCLWNDESKVCTFWKSLYIMSCMVRKTRKSKYSKSEISMLLNVQLCYILAMLIYVFLPFNLINYQSNILSQIMGRYEMSEMYFGNKDTTINRTITGINLF